MKTAIIIPALNPDNKLINIVDKLKKISKSAIVIVDDGSRDDCRVLFKLLEDKYSCIVCRHIVNMGKGAALKTGIRRATQMYPELLGVVTADADGQHLSEDIVRIEDALPDFPESLILGMRNFSGADVPKKSRLGNRITSFIFLICTKIHCPDTQTGLRGIPISLIDFCLSVSGERFEYETNLLIAAAKKGIHLEMLPISTVYLENNHSSHFHPVKDSVRIYYNIFKEIFSIPNDPKNLETSTGVCLIRSNSFIILFADTTP
jgi:glycosyltransferase involved in cell wall biosynthesis